MQAVVRISYFVPRVRIVHWKASEAGPLLEACRAAGWQADYDPDENGAAVSRGLRETMPDAVAIDLSRRPSSGRDVAVWLRNQKRYRHLPIVFVNGAAEKTEAIRALLPDTTFTETERLAAVLKAGPPAGTVVPPSMMERYSDRTVAEKLGIADSTRVGVMDPPDDYAAALGVLPEGAEVVEGREQQVTLWFIEDMDQLFRSLRRMRTMAGRTKLWIVWRKGSKNGVTQNGIREAAIEAGLVDYKICALNDGRSGILFARKKE